jgi:hypothetical protein
LAFFAFCSGAVHTYSSHSQNAKFWLLSQQSFYHYCRGDHWSPAYSMWLWLLYRLPHIF